MHGGDNPAVHVLKFRDRVDTSAGVPVPLRAGGMSFHHARTHHYAGINRTSRIRRAWANEFQTTPVARAVPKEFPWVAAGKKALAEAVEQRK
jgi:ectoine hydroxylase-related dioxygenase (phytanoyl-CoA dioxygenase family)